MIDHRTCSLHFLLIDQQRASVSTSNAHSFAQRSEDWTVLFFLPNLRKRLAILLLQIVVFCKPIDFASAIWRDTYEMKQLTLEMLPMVPRIQALLRQLLPRNSCISTRKVVGRCHLREFALEIELDRYRCPIRHSLDL